MITTQPPDYFADIPNYVHLPTYLVIDLSENNFFERVRELFKFIFTGKMKFKMVKQ